MAVDEALLLAHALGDSAPVIRFYRWQPATVSLGRFQELTRLPQLASSYPFPLVRRPTGGRAVLHQHEITYSAVLREVLLPPGERSVMQAYRWLSAGLMAGLSRLGVPSQLAPADGVAGDELGEQANCFHAAARCDLVSGGRKLVGSAQCRKFGAILQHGSLLLSVDEASWRQALGGASPRMVSLQELGVTADVECIQHALVQGLQQQLEAPLVNSGCTAVELRLADFLEHSKYTNPAWLESGRLSHEPDLETLKETLGLRL